MRQASSCSWAGARGNLVQLSSRSRQSCPWHVVEYGDLLILAAPVAVIPGADLAHAGGVCRRPIVAEQRSGDGALFASQKLPRVSDPL